MSLDFEAIPYSVVYSTDGLLVALASKTVYNTYLHLRSVRCVSGILCHIFEQNNRPQKSKKKQNITQLIPLLVTTFAVCC